MQSIDEPIDVRLDEEGPTSFVWRGGEYHVTEVLHTWTTNDSQWWKPSRGRKRQHYRVHAERARHRITAEVASPAKGKGDAWVLSVIIT